MTWLDRLFKDNKTKEIEVELLDETEKSIKVKLENHTTFLPKIRVTFGNLYEGNKLKVKLPMWLYRKNFN